MTNFMSDLRQFMSVQYHNTGPSGNRLFVVYYILVIYIVQNRINRIKILPFGEILSRK